MRVILFSYNAETVMNIRFLTLLAGLVSIMSVHSCASGNQASEAESIIGKHTVHFSEPPKEVPTQGSTDAPLLGNGYTGVALSGMADEFVFRFARNDFWRLKSSYNDSYPLVLGKAVLSVPDMEGASYSVDQHLYTAVTDTRFAKDGKVLSCEIYVAATEDVMVVEMSNEGQETISGSLLLSLPGKDEINDDPHFDDVRQSGTDNKGIQYISRAYTESVDIPTKAAVAMNVEGSADGNFVLEPGKSMTMVCAFSSNFKSEDCLKAVIEKVSSCSKGVLSRLRRDHEGWWKEYWDRSYVSIPDPVIEMHYYRSLYGMASCSRDADFPPSIFGTWITKEQPWWLGDYHLNYNHMAPYYALYGANRIEQADPYYAPLLAMIPRGNWYSEQIAGIPDGVILPVGIGPLGIETTRQSEFVEKYCSHWIKDGNVEAGGLFWGQKSNSAYAVVNLNMQFYRTWDEEFARKVYPFVKGVAAFWEKYLVREGDRYIIINDAIHEGTVGTMNPIASLGLVRMVFKTACDMSELLGIDEERREIWKERHDHMSEYPLQEINGKTVFRYTERGVDWWHDNTLGIQHIYPAGAIGLASDPQLKEIALNTLEELGRWDDFNGTNSFFPAAVRLGYDPETILEHLHAYSLDTYGNGFRFENPHGIENFSTVPNTINEMMCMGHQDIVRIFPVWPRSMDASFHNIRVEGAFLVSSSIKDGIISEVTLISEKGRNLTLLNPWNGQNVEIISSDGRKSVASGEYISMETSPGITYCIVRK